MARACTVCKHEQRQTIDELIAASALPITAIAKKYSLHEDAVARHKTKHVLSKIAKAVAKREEKATDRFLDHVEFLMDESRQYVEDAHGAVKVQCVGPSTYREYRDVGAMAGAINAARGVGELYGQATGRLNQASPAAGGINLVVVMPRELSQAVNLPLAQVVDITPAAMADPTLPLPLPVVVDDKQSDDDQQ